MMAQMNHLEYIEYLCKQYRTESEIRKDFDFLWQFAKDVE